MMTDRIRGLWYLIGGGFLVLLSLDLLVKVVLAYFCLWMIDHGMRLRGAYPLFERIRAFLHTV
jgi:hypothetical protein